MVVCRRSLIRRQVRDLPHRFHRVGFALEQTEDTLTIGPSAMHWDGDRLVIHVNEISTPHGNRIEGTVTIRPSAITPSELPLARDGSEDDFSYWTWARLPLEQGTACLYDANRRDGSTLAAGFSFAPDGTPTELDLPPKARLAPSLWALRRETRADAGYQPKQVKHMLDAPFYNRAAIRTQINGEETVGVHEALDLNRFASPLLKPMLAVRVPRRANWKS